MEEADSRSFNPVPPMEIPIPRTNLTPETPVKRDAGLTVLGPSQYSLATSCLAKVPEGMAHGEFFAELEQQWGGLPMVTSECLRLRARYAAQHGIPISTKELLEQITKDVSQDRVNDCLSLVNAKLGGDDVTERITPFWWFLSRFPEDTLIAEFPLPKTVEGVINVIDDKAN